MFTLREVTEEDSFVVKGAPFTQSYFYGLWQKYLDRPTKSFVVESAGGVVAYFQTITYSLVFGKTCVYMPYGPVVVKPSKELFVFLKKELARLGKKEGSIFVRLDAMPPVKKEFSQGYTKAPRSTYTSAYFQPRAEWALELSKTEEELLKDMHQKTRYSIRGAERHGVEIEIVTDNFLEHFDDFYNLMLATAERNKFSLHPKEYYRGIFENLSSERGYLVVSKYEGEVLSSSLICVFAGVANYVFGGSGEDRKHTPSYLAQWESVKHAKSIGCDSYSFGGISTEEFPVSGWKGITQFKKRFGGAEVSHGEFLDVVIQPLFYYLYVLRKFLKGK
jgi:peptidoglycan pentaglycine glycine transferase (the first glycine)